MVARFEKEKQESEAPCDGYDNNSDSTSVYSGHSSSDLPIPLSFVDTGKAAEDMPSQDTETAKDK